MPATARHDRLRPLRPLLLCFLHPLVLWPLGPLVPCPLHPLLLCFLRPLVPWSLGPLVPSSHRPLLHAPCSKLPAPSASTRNIVPAAARTIRNYSRQSSPNPLRKPTPATASSQLPTATKVDSSSALFCPRSSLRRLPSPHPAAAIRPCGPRPLSPMSRAAIPHPDLQTPAPQSNNRRRWLLVVSPDRTSRD